MHDCSTDELLNSSDKGEREATDFRMVLMVLGILQRLFVFKCIFIHQFTLNLTTKSITSFFTQHHILLYDRVANRISQMRISLQIQKSAAKTVSHVFKIYTLLSIKFESIINYVSLKMIIIAFTFCNTLKIRVVVCRVIIHCCW